MLYILNHFHIESKAISCEAFGSGHIHDTFKVTTEGENEKDYLLQKINHQVFPKVPEMMNNIKLVTTHIQAHLERKWADDYQETLTLIRAKNDLWHYQDLESNYWRVFEFLPNRQSFDLVETPDQAYEGAKSYGNFLKYLDDFQADQITDVIPDFHNLILRLEAFEQSLLGASKERLSQTEKQVEFIRKVGSQLCGIQEQWDLGLLQTRVTHNDTKFNNVLLSPEGKGKCVIDLDTVMQGVVHFDFGDGVRTGAAQAIEDDRDLQIVGIDMAKFEGFTSGYLEASKDFLSSTEIRSLAQSCALMPFIMGVRFLTDYLQGDTYYKITYPDHNWVRAQNQLKMTQECMKREDDLGKIIKRA